jgi:uncharacterized protein YbaR (Trm112 family)
VVNQELLEILRCPHCVRDGPDAGQLDRQGNWLICHDCDRKYPIRDDIPVMLIEEGERFQNVPREELPEVPPPEARQPLLAISAGPPQLTDQQRLALALAGLALGAGLVVLVIALLRKKSE